MQVSKKKMSIVFGLFFRTVLVFHQTCRALALAKLGVTMVGSKPTR